jgi:CelD/BcsL family acetyltransferase involved in cellulose biosynthesis
LYVLAVYDEQEVLRGLAPWMLESSIRGGRVLRMLGSGEVCSDYLSLLASADAADGVAEVLASWLTQQARGRNAREGDFRWDLLELSGVDAEDEAVATLVNHLRRQGNAVHCRPGPQCWRIQLPATWDDYLAGLSKSHRKKLRRLERNVLHSDRARIHRVGQGDDLQTDDLQTAMAILVDLHQRRFRRLGKPGCFASVKFSGFLHEAAAQMAVENGLRLYWIEWEGNPIAAEFQLLGDAVVYAYQAGMDPDRLDLQPGRLSCIAALQQAIMEGRTAFDLLRGDEPFKAHWGAVPRPSLHVRIAPRKPLALARHVTWLAGRGAKDVIKGGLAAVGLRRGSSRAQSDKQSPLRRGGAEQRKRRQDDHTRMNGGGVEQPRIVSEQ